MEKEKKEALLQEAASAAVPSADSEKPTLIITLTESFMWDGEEVKEVDLSGLYDMTAEDMFQVDQQMRIRGFSGMNPEITRQYAMLTAAKINHKPWEWLNRIKARDAVRIKNVVAGFFFMQG